MIEHLWGRPFTIVVVSLWMVAAATIGLPRAQAQARTDEPGSEAPGGATPGDADADTPPSSGAGHASNPAEAPEDLAAPPGPAGTLPSAPAPYRTESPPGAAGCVSRAQARFQSTEYVVCEDGRLFRAGTQGSRVVPLSGQAVGLFQHGGQLWVELVRRSAVVVPQLEEETPKGVPPARESRRPLVSGTPLTPESWEAEPTAPEPPPAAPDREDPNHIAPTRITGWEYGVLPRLFLGSGSLGTLTEGWVGYRAESPFFVRAQADALGYGLGEDENFGLYALSLLSGFDHEWFEMGVGLGLMRVRVDDFTRTADGTSLSTSVSFRLGARDGLHLQITNGVVFVDDSPLYAGTQGAAQVPLGPTAWLIARGGGNGVTSHGYGELGLRLLLDGDRGPGSLFVTPAFGGVVLDDPLSFATHGGFSMSFAIEYRP